MKRTIVVGGSVCPRGEVVESFLKRQPEVIFSDLIETFAGAWFSIVNLETPLGTSSSPIAKIGATFSAPTAVIDTLALAGVRAVNLANNHIMDQGSEGLRLTIEAARGAGVQSLGAGNDLRVAAEPLILDDPSGWRLGVLGFADPEFSTATKGRPGANPLDVFHVMESLEKVRSTCDAVLVLIHAGVEHQLLPNPFLRRFCRFIAGRGASAVVCQHSHCAGAWERHNGVPIIYGQGDLLDDGSTLRASARNRSGVIISLEWDSERPKASPEVNLEPFTQSDGHIGSRRAHGEQAETIAARIRRASRLVVDDEAFAQHWEALCRSKRANYVSRLLGHGRALRWLNQRLDLSALLYSRRAVGVILNLLRSSSHREILSEVVEGLWNDKQGGHIGRPR